MLIKALPLKTSEYTLCFDLCDETSNFLRAFEKIEVRKEEKMVSLSASQFYELLEKIAQKGE